jgi:hypothetical protein
VSSPRCTMRSKNTATNPVTNAFGGSFHGTFRSMGQG